MTTNHDHDQDRDVDAEQMTQHKPAHEAAMRNHTDQIVSTILDVMPLDREAYWEHAQMAADAIARLDKPVPPVDGEHTAAIKHQIYDLQFHPMNGGEATSDRLAAIERHADALAHQLAVSEARVDLLMPLYAAALAFRQAHSSTDYPGNDPSVCETEYALLQLVWDIYDENRLGDLPAEGEGK